MGRIFLFSGDILMFSMMISRIENQVKAYMTYLNFLRRTFQLPWSLFYSEKIGKMLPFF